MVVGCADAPDRAAFERPDLVEESKRLAIETEINRRIRGGEEQMAWLTIPNAMIELDALISELKPELCGSLKAYRERLQARLVFAE